MNANVQIIIKPEKSRQAIQKLFDLAANRGFRLPWTLSTFDGAGLLLITKYGDGKADVEYGKADVVEASGKREISMELESGVTVVLREGKRR